jgi:hypothetical protein
MPKNSKVNIKMSSTDCFECACGFTKVFERACDVKGAVIRHARFCEIASEPLKTKEGRFETKNLLGKIVKTHSSPKHVIIKTSK